MGYFCAAASVPSLVLKLAFTYDAKLTVLNAIMLIQITTESLAFTLSSKFKESVAFYNSTWSLSDVGKPFTLMQSPEPKLASH